MKRLAMVLALVAMGEQKPASAPAADTSHMMMSDTSHMMMADTSKKMAPAAPAPAAPAAKPAAKKKP